MTIARGHPAVHGEGVNDGHLGRFLLRCRVRHAVPEIASQQPISHQMGPTSPGAACLVWGCRCRQGVRLGRARYRKYFGGLATGPAAVIAAIHGDLARYVAEVRLDRLHRESRFLRCTASAQGAIDDERRNESCVRGHPSNPLRQRAQDLRAQDFYSDR
jgi:hypothetical protein